MHAFGLISALALVGSTIAAPVPEPEVVVVVETKVATVVVTAGAEPTVQAAQAVETKVATVVVTAGAAPTVKAAQAPESYRQHRTRPHYSVVTVSTSVAAVQPTTSVSVAAAPTKPATTAAPTTAKPTTTAAPTTAKPTTAKPTTSAAAPSSTAPATGGSDYISIVNKWRGKMSLSTLTQDSKLEANAKKTCVDGNGKMVHELNSGTMGQVLAPGGANDFEKVFVGGWLCEVPSTPGLDGICSSMSSGWDYQGQTGHNSILTSKSYTKIGCALANGIWGCDVA